MRLTGQYLRYPRYLQSAWVSLLSVAVVMQVFAAEVGAGEPPAPSASPVVNFAKTLLGVPYTRGGVLPETGFDCSGFVQYVFRQLETFVPRSAADLYRQSQKVSVHALQPGDMLFFKIRSRALSHVAIYLGDGKFIHAPRPGHVVSIERLDAPYYQKHLSGAARVLVPDSQTIAPNRPTSVR